MYDFHDCPRPERLKGFAKLDTAPPLPVGPPTRAILIGIGASAATVVVGALAWSLGSLVQ